MSFASSSSSSARLLQHTAATALGRVVARMRVVASTTTTVATTRRLTLTTTPTWSRAFSSPAKVNMALVKQLRESSGAPITECKDAIAAAMSQSPAPANDQALLQAANEVLRKKGVSTASKKAGRNASEGLSALVLSADRKCAAAFEVNSETDFCARNERFIALMHQIAPSALAVRPAAPTTGTYDVQQLATAPLAAEPTRTVHDAVTDVVTALRENISLRRAASLRVQHGVIGSYVHNAVASSSPAAGDAAMSVRLGKSACILALEASGPVDQASLLDLANKLAMQVVAAAPQYLSRERVPAAVVEKERAILTEQATNTAKNPKQLEKMIEGRLNKFFEDNVLLEQKSVVIMSQEDKPIKINAMLEAESKKRGVRIELVEFVRFVVGEGKQVEATMSFADEVKAKIAKA